MLKILQKIIISFITTIFVVALFFCLSIEMSHTNKISGSCCSFASAHTSNHKINLNEHLQHWQQIFISMRISKSDLSILLGIFFISLKFFPFFLQFKTNEVKINVFSAKIYKERNAITKLFHPIAQALSKGILNPKIYNLSSSLIR